MSVSVKRIGKTIVWDFVKKITSKEGVRFVKERNPSTFVCKVFKSVLFFDGLIGNLKRSVLPAPRAS